jgi:hypothetical protein
LGERIGVRVANGVDFVEGLVSTVKKKGGNYLDNISKYTKLFKEGKVKELFDELKKTDAPPELGKTIPRNHANVRAEYHQKYGEDATNYPHSEAHPITRFTLAEIGYFVHVLEKGQKPGRWLIRIEDFKAFKGNIKEMTEKLALPGEPTHFSLVELPKGTSLHKSVSGPLHRTI